MKKLKLITAATLVTTFLASPALVLAADAKADAKAGTKAAKAYTLKVCPVSDEKLGEMGDPYVFVHEGREIKLCCKGCLDDFKKTPAKFVKKIEAAEKASAPKKS